MQHHYLTYYAPAFTECEIPNFSAESACNEMLMHLLRSHSVEMEIRNPFLQITRAAEERKGVGTGKNRTETLTHINRAACTHVNMSMPTGKAMHAIST